MKQWLKDHWGYLITFLSGVVAVLAALLSFKYVSRTNIPDPFKDLEKDALDRLDKSEKELDNLNKNGVEDLSKDDVVDYWNKQ